MERLASGAKDHYYGKADVTVYRLIRDGRVPAGRSPVFGASVKLLTWGGAFWPTYLRGDNTGLIATDSMKNFIHRETFTFAEFGLENYCRFIGEKFLGTYPQVEGLQMTALQIPYEGLEGGVACIPSGPDQAFARIEMRRVAAACRLLAFHDSDTAGEKCPNGDVRGVLQEQQRPPALIRLCFQLAQDFEDFGRCFFLEVRHWLGPISHQSWPRLCPTQAGRGRSER